MNIAFGKFGKSTLFEQKKWGMIGGDHESSGLLVTLAQLNPNITFYLVGRSDWSRLSPVLKNKICPNKNIVDVWENGPSSPGYKAGNAIAIDHDARRYYQKYPTEVLRKKGIKIDLGLFMSGTFSTINAYDTCYLKTRPDEVALIKNNMVLQYSAPIVHFLNETMIPYYEIGEDPRYFPNCAYDLYNRPVAVLSTKNKESKEFVSITEKLSKITKKTVTPILNKKIAHLFLANEDANLKLKEPGKRTHTIDVYSHGHSNSGAFNKFPIIKDYILDQFSDSCIFGDWPKPSPEVQQYSHRIKSIPMIDMTNHLLNTKYAFIINVKPGWATSKVFKHILFGNIPFFHSSANIEYYEKLPDELVVNTPKELLEKIKTLDSDKNLYLQLWNKCQELLEDQWFDGTAINNSIMKKVIPNYKGPQGKKSLVYTCLWKKDYIKEKNTLF